MKAACLGSVFCLSFVFYMVFLEALLRDPPPSPDISLVRCRRFVEGVEAPAAGDL